MAISIFRTVILYGLIIIAVRLMGKRQIGEMQTSELVVTLLISDIASMPMQNTETSLLSGIVPMMILVVCEILLSLFMLRRAWIRRLVCGMPQIIIKNGKIDQKQMKKLRLSTEDLCEDLRQQGYFKLSEIEYAVMETNGKLSVLKNPAEVAPNCKQLGIKPEQSEIETVVISDGELSISSLKVLGIDREKIDRELNKRKLQIRDVFIMTVSGKDNFRVIKREEKL